MHRSFKYRLYPTPDQAEVLGQWVGVTRLVYNLALEQRRDFWRQFKATEGKTIGMPSQSRELTAMRAEFDWMDAVPREALESALKDLDLAFAAFFRGGGFPKPRRLGDNDSTRFQARALPVEKLNAKWARVKVPRLGWVRFRQPRAAQGRFLTGTFSRSGGQWFLVSATDIGERPAIGSLPMVGIDRGISTTLSLSNGEHIRLPDMTALEYLRRRAQRIMSRRKKGSRRRSRQRLLLRRLTSQIARTRAHHLHVASKNIAGRFGVVAIEALKIKAMTATAKGSLEDPGSRVRQKAGLNRSILAQGWGMFAAQLNYKLEAVGGRLVYVNPAYTSQTCADCGVVDARSRKSQAVFECVACGHSDHADTNAAKNIMRGSTAFVEARHSGRSVEARTLAA